MQRTRIQHAFYHRRFVRAADAGRYVPHSIEAERMLTMNRRVLAIPKEELEAQFEKNERQDIKIIVPSILTDDLFRKLIAKGKKLKPEVPHDGIRWKHSAASEANKVCESGDFLADYLPQDVKGPFSISFANELAEQESHYHKKHFEMYYSEHPMSAEFRYIEDSQAHEPIELKNGGLILFSPNVIHKMHLGGLTIVIEVASMEDKENENL